MAEGEGEGLEVHTPHPLFVAVLHAEPLERADPLPCPLLPVTVGVEERVGRAENVNPPALVVKEVALTVALPVPPNTLSVDRLDSEREGDAEEEGYALALPLKESQQEPVDKAEAVVVGVKLAHPVEDTVLVGAFTVGE